ncbi:MAG: hypothetical protein ACOYB7_09145 [Mycobacterium sp.]
MTKKLLATCVAAAAIAGGAAAGAVSITPISSPAVALVVFGVPLPQDPAADLPTADQLSGVLAALADPGVPFAAKGYLVEGGIGRLEARAADGLMQKAVAKGQVPLNFGVSNIAPAGPGAASANVAATGPSMPATTKNITFVDQGGWKISRASAAAVLSMFSA